MREAVQSGDGADRWGGVRIQRKTGMRRSAGGLVTSTLGLGQGECALLDLVARRIWRTRRERCGQA